jgi:(4S)-4-hydroxy-5-phosphonooxypentane-2,3-dione isomerase
MMHRIETFEVRREHVDAARKLVAAFADEVGRKEGGTASFLALQQADAPTRFVLVMAFRVPSAAQYHDGTAWGKRFRAELAPLCSQPVEARAMEPVQG